MPHLVAQRLRAALTLCLALAAAPWAVAQPAFPPAQGVAVPALSPWRPLLGVSATTGGDTLVSVAYTDGTRQNVKSGGLVHLFGGVEYDTGAVVVQATLGYHTDDTNASNGSVKFSRYPVELLGLWKAPGAWRVGGGVRKALGARVSSSGAARPGVGGARFGSELGVVLQGEYVFGDGSVFLRQVRERYTVDRRTVDGDHVGIGVAFRF